MEHLLLDPRHRAVRTLIRPVSQPSIVRQRRRRHRRPRRPRVLIRIQRAQIPADLLQNLPPVLARLPLFDSLPRHIERRQPRQRIPEPLLALRVRRQQPADQIPRTEKRHIHQNSALIRVPDLRLRRLEKLRRLERPGRPLIHQRHAQMIELLRRPRVHQRLPPRQIHLRKTRHNPAHPQMRRQSIPLHKREMMQIRRPQPPRLLIRRRREMPFLAAERRVIAGQPIRVLARLRRRIPDQPFRPAIPHRPHQRRVMMRRPELRLQRQSLPVGRAWHVEQNVARRIPRRRPANRLRPAGKRAKQRHEKDPKDHKSSVIVSGNKRATGQRLTLRLRNGSRL